MTELNYEKLNDEDLMIIIKNSTKELSKRKLPKSTQIINLVRSWFGLTLSELTSDSKERRLIIPRSIAMKCLHDRGFTHKQIGSIFNRNPSSVGQSITTLIGYKFDKDKNYYVSIMNDFEKFLQFVENKKA